MDTSEQKSLLLKRREEITSDLAEIEDRLDEPMSDDMDDLPSERQEDEVLQARGNSDVDRIRAIDAALDRIENGSYGTCASCGAEISDERLKAVPETALCRDCARSA
ncbi:TraR/DksA C4-type zinc finger protein [Marivita sp. GX14005]|uniref:TraR/DksA family transcriptional regulator n=1 Tax=Marivita sp. GX14005 TaxID=2942276 RepID=UPI0020190B3F|nr:TraR/DksA C4-type zinc finger protein [Marivita sp. GX14005]MCL3880950.1 TraR/DksA C4-type zinc finger protein [Marivita sp. GX14005]